MLGQVTPAGHLLVEVVIIMNRIRKSRLPILALLAVFSALPGPSDASNETDKVTTLAVRNASVCNESTLRFIVNRDTNEIWLVRPTKLWKLDQHFLKVGYGTSLQQVTHEFTVVQAGSWSLEVFEPSQEVPDLYGPDMAGQTRFTLERPVSIIPGGYEFTIVPTPFGEEPPLLPATLPDVVIEPQTGCPPDNLVILPPEND